MTDLVFHNFLYGKLEHDQSYNSWTNIIHGNAGKAMAQSIQRGNLPTETDRVHLAYV